MIIPEKVRILYKEYDIEHQKNLHDGGCELYGQIHYLPEKIYLNPDASMAMQKATLLHELLHGLDEMYGIDLKEKQVEKLGNALYMLIKDNPKMFERGDVH